MKKTIILSAAALLLMSAAHAQSSLLSKASSAVSAVKTANTVAKVTGVSTSSLAASLVKSQLQSKLGLSSGQVPSVTSAVTTYLNGKEKITSLLKSNPTAYATKQAGLFSSLKSNLSNTLTPTQLAKFVALKSTTSSSSPLATLFK